MTVSTTQNRISYNGDASSTVFSFPYKFLATSDLKVYVGGVLQTITTDYAVGTPSDTGANVTFVSAPAAGVGNIVIVRDADLLQQAALKSNGKFPAETVEDMVDKVTLIAQRLEDKFDQSLVVPDSETLSATLPDQATRAGMYLSFDVNGDPEVVNAVVDINTVAGIASDITTVSGIAAAVSTVAGISADVSAVAANAANINAVAANEANITAVAGNSANINAVVADEVDIGIVATNIASVNTVAANITSKLGATMVPLSDLLAASSVGDSDLFLTRQGTTDKSVSGAVLRSGLQTFQQSGAGSVIRSMNDKAKERVSVEDYGADPTGATDSYAAIQDAIDEVSSRGGGVVEFQTGGLYKISQGLVSNKPVLLRAEVRGDISSNTNGGSYATAKPTILYIGVTPDHMYSIRPAIVGDVVWGGGADGLEWNGNDIALGGVLLDNTKYALFDGKVRQVTFSGVTLTSDSGSVGNFSMKNHVRSLEFVWGTVAACQNAHGLSFGGNGSTVPATQQYIGDVSGLVYNGSLVYIAETDNAQFGSVHAAVQSPGTGCAVFLQFAGAQPSNHNFFNYVVGEFRQQNGIVGNTILHYISEGGGITVTAGSAKWDGELSDYVTGKRFKSHTYALRKKIELPAGAFIGGAGTGLGNLALQWQTLTHSAAGTGRVSAVLPPFYDIDNGKIEGVEIFIGTNGTSAGNYRLQALLSTVGTGSTSGVVTPEVSMLQTVAAPAQYQISKYTFVFSPELAIANGNLIVLAIDRLAADALDTNSDDSFFLGARILYRGTGPDSAGSGTYFIPEW